MGAGTFNNPQQGYGQQQYGQQQYGQPPQAYGAPHAQGRSGMAVAGLILGIIALLTFVFGVLGRNEARKQGKDGEGMGTAGLVLGIVAIVLTIPWALYVSTL
jgi:hypothetical protein